MRRSSASDRARTELEQRMLSLCRRHRLPKPEVNVKVDRFEVDFLWRRERLIVRWTAGTRIGAARPSRKIVPGMRGWRSWVTRSSASRGAN